MKSKMPFAVSRKYTCDFVTTMEAWILCIHRVSFQDKLRKSTGALSRHPGLHKCHRHRQKPTEKGGKKSELLSECFSLDAKDTHGFFSLIALAYVPPNYIP